MKKISILLLIFIITLSSCMFGQDKGIQFEHGTMTEILAKAAVENKLVFVDCYTEWCGPCKNMAAIVFKEDSVADFMNAHFINIKMDMEKGEGPALQKKYRVGAYPSFLLLDKNGNLVFKFVGGMPSDAFLKNVRKGMNPENKVAIMNQQYANGDRSKTFLREYIKLKIEMMETSSAKEIAAEYFEMLSPEERTLPENWFLFGENRYSLYLSNIYFGNNFNYLAEHWQEFAKTIPIDSIENKLGSSFRKIADYCLRGWYFKERPYNKTDFECYRSWLKNTALKDKEQLITLMNVAQAAGEKDTTKVINLLADNIASFSEENKRILFGFLRMFDSSVSTFRQNVRTSEIFEKIIQTSANNGLVDIAKAYQKKLTSK